MSEYFKEIDKLNKDDLLSQKTAEELFCIDEPERTVTYNLLYDRAKELKCATEFKEFVKAYKRSIKEANKITSYVEVNPLYSALDLELTDKGQVKKTIPNFEKIVQNENDAFLKTLKFNDLSNRMEIGGEPFTDKSANLVRTHIGRAYGIYDRKMLDDVLMTVALGKHYHPIMQKIENIKRTEKDGLIEDFLHTTILCEDNEYTREVSRLIFAGGIHRLYNPGCKFDDVIVFIGKQGCGKSTIVRWLALDDDYYRTVSTFKDKEGMEILSGAWICELPELTALKRTNNNENKDFIARQKDTFRKAYGTYVEDYKRQCIFIGTTNHMQFLTDLTGNRRYYPVTATRDGHTLFDNEADFKYIIEQCWAEALDRYRRNKLPLNFNPKLESIANEYREAALEDDWRIGMIEEYLKDKQEVCILGIYQDGLRMGSFAKPTRKESNEITLIMQGFKDWKKQRGTKRFKDYGPHSYWKKEVDIPY